MIRFSRWKGVENTLKDLVDGSTKVMPDTATQYIYETIMSPYELRSYLITGSEWLDIDAVIIE